MWGWPKTLKLGTELIWLKKKPEGSITLYNYFWKEKEGGKDPKVEWKILEKNLQTFNPVTDICRLCTREKFNIVMKPEKATLNSRQEIFGHCRHKRSTIKVNWETAWVAELLLGSEHQVSSSK